MLQHVGEISRLSVGFCISVGIVRTEQG